MEANNNTGASDFILEGLSDYPHLRGLFFGIFLCAFVAAVQANSLIVLAMMNVLLVTMSYGFIIRSILKIQGSEGKRKTFSTCSSHLAVVGLFYPSIIYSYIWPSSSHSRKDKLVVVLYAFVTPLLNPPIYSLRIKEV
ncbi:hypothetical protein Y1Q_0003940 [Alligator mississippiensis]|uniref:G-protein coupled receptors family 1 profile domain-containing protein n=1 Tax=Alligator mississippiensis TaxID=8496 RepID=A0A151P0K2_ALLMI|nr:hypothetical protein Y1Q_0003940 [Alligator mississippiensis]